MTGATNASRNCKFSTTLKSKVATVKKKKKKKEKGGTGETNLMLCLIQNIYNIILTLDWYRRLFHN